MDGNLQALKILGSWHRFHMHPELRVGGLAKKMKLNLRDVVLD
jgi:hypothetical protein